MTPRSATSFTKQLGPTGLLSHWPLSALATEYGKMNPVAPGYAHKCSLLFGFHMLAWMCGVLPTLGVSLQHHSLAPVQSN